jgi:hypothetical protein
VAVKIIAIINKIPDIKRLIILLFVLNDKSNTTNAATQKSAVNIREITNNVPSVDDCAIVVEIIIIVITQL